MPAGELVRSAQAGPQAPGWRQHTRSVRTRCPPRPTRTWQYKNVPTMNVPLAPCCSYWRARASGSLVAPTRRLAGSQHARSMTAGGTCRTSSRPYPRGMLGAALGLGLAGLYTGWREPSWARESRPIYRDFGEWPLRLAAALVIEARESGRARQWVYARGSGRKRRVLACRRHGARGVRRRRDAHPRDRPARKSAVLPAHAVDGRRCSVDRKHTDERESMAVRGHVLAAIAGGGGAAAAAMQAPAAAAALASCFPTARAGLASRWTMGPGWARRMAAHWSRPSWAGLVQADGGLSTGPQGRPPSS